MKRVFFILLAAVAMLVSVPAEAYIGPGPGFGMRGEFMALMGVLALCICLMLALPIRSLIRKFRKPKPPAGE
jgi:uncharacterized membrane protein